MRTEPSQRPPRWASRILEFLIRDEAQTPAGDYEEYYNNVASDRGIGAARMWYVGQLLRLIPERIMAHLYWALVMWKNYLVVGRRNLVRNRVASSINLFGLSISIAACIAVFLTVKDFVTVDHFHANGDLIYLINHDAQEETEVATWGMSPAPLGPALEARFPQIEHSIRILRSRASFTRGEKALPESITYVDNHFFDVFSFPLRLGVASSLPQPEAVIISDRIAIKYFGAQNPIGEEISLSFGDSELVPFIIQGVAEPFPTNASFRFDVLLSIDNSHALTSVQRHDWAQSVDGTFIQLRPGTDIGVIEDEMESFIDIQNAADPDWKILAFSFENLRNKGLSAFTVRRRATYATEWPFMIVIILVPLFMMALSCINYVNISLGGATRRLKEIGIRKVAGSSKQQLILQFLAENLILCLCSLVVGVFIAAVILVPVFNDLFVEPISMNLASDMSLWGFLLVLLVTIGLISGAYPAFYISSFPPVAILRRHETITRTAWLTRSLMTVQFILAFISVIVSAYLSKNNEHLLTIDWGYNPDNTMVVEIYDPHQFDRLKDALSSYPQLEVISGAEEHVGTGADAARISIGGAEKTVRRLDVGDDYFNSMGIEMADGREFQTERSAEDRTSAIVNKAFVLEEGWDTPIDQSFRLDGIEYSVVGVIDNVLTNLMASDYPVLFLRTDPAQYTVATIRIRAGAEENAVQAVESVWASTFPGDPVTHFFQREIFDISYGSLRKLNRMFMAIALISLFIACMGLFGLAAQNAVSRMKEMAIRKSLGGSASHLAYILNRQFMVLLALAAVLSTALCYFGINGILGLVKSNNLPLGGMPFIASYVIVLATAALAVSVQSKKIAHVNPAEVLKSE